MSRDGIRDAATVILVRDPAGAASILMGQRGARAAFMPDKFVFPGGAVDADDARVASSPDPATAKLLGAEGPALLAAAVRELWEEAGLLLARPGKWDAPAPPHWRAFAERGLVPATDALKFVFRAITPPGRSRRFDARFFVADAAALLGDPDDFTHATDELSNLQWVPIEVARSFDLPFITEVVLAEVVGALPRIATPELVPFFDNTTGQARFRHLGVDA